MGVQYLTPWDRVVREEDSTVEGCLDREESLLDLLSVMVELVLGRPVPERDISGGISSRVSSKPWRKSWDRRREPEPLIAMPEEDG